MHRPQPPARQRILDTAASLFYRDGLRATGIDRIIAESGVAKMSFYRHFPSKADLIATFLRTRHEQWMTWFRQELERHLDPPGKGLEAIADVLAAWFRQPDFRGCAFINTVVESGIGTTAERSLAIEHKDELLNFLAGVSKRLRLPRPRRVAEAALLIIEGAIVRAQMGAAAKAVAVSRELLRDLGRQRAD